MSLTCCTYTLKRDPSHCILVPTTFIGAAGAITSSIPACSSPLGQAGFGLLALISLIGSVRIACLKPEATLAQDAIALQHAEQALSQQREEGERTLTDLRKQLAGVEAELARSITLYKTLEADYAASQQTVKALTQATIDMESVFAEEDTHVQAATAAAQENMTVLKAASSALEEDASRFHQERLRKDTSIQRLTEQVVHLHTVIEKLEEKLNAQEEEKQELIALVAQAERVAATIQREPFPPRGHPMN